MLRSPVPTSVSSTAIDELPVVKTLCACVATGITNKTMNVTNLNEKDRNIMTSIRFDE